MAHIQAEELEHAFCQTSSTYKRAELGSCAAPRPLFFFFKKPSINPLSKSLLCVSAAVRSLSQFDRRLRKKERKKTMRNKEKKKKNPASFLASFHKAKQKQLHRLASDEKWKRALLLQEQHASSCIYHTLKSHPVPLGHVTFENATVNDSVVHGGTQKES